MTTDRRTFLKSAAGGLAFAGLRAGNNKPLIRGALGELAHKSRTPVKNIVVVMMENRSVDHLLGWYGKENAHFDAIQEASVPELRAGRSGRVQRLNWGANGLHSYHGRQYRDPNHSWDGARAERAGGRADGWLDPVTKNDEFALGYYDDIDVPVWAQLVRQYQSYDRWHCSLLGPTQPNRYYMHSGQSGTNKNNDPPPVAAQKLGKPEWYTGFDWATIWKLLDRHGVSGSYFIGNLPVLGYWGRRHVNRIRPVADFFAQCDAGVLPQVSYVDPFYTLGESFGNDDHPHADLRLGQAFLSDVVEAFTNSRHYEHGAMVVTYDEWGGFFDHVNPPRIADDHGTPRDPAGKDDFAQIGFRVPSSIVSPWTATKGAVDHTVYDHASVVRFITENWGLPYLTKRVRSTNSIEGAFRGFRQYQPEARFSPYEAPLKVTVNSLNHAVGKTVQKEANDPTSLPLVGRIPGAPEWPLPPVFPPEPPAPSPHSASGPGDGFERALAMGWFEKHRIRTDYKLEDAFYRSRPELLADVRATLS